MKWFDAKITISWSSNSEKTEKTDWITLFQTGIIVIELFLEGTHATKFQCS